MVMVTVQDFDVHPRVSHLPSEKPKLTRNFLLQALNENLSFSENPDSGCVERLARCGSVGEQEMRYAATVYHPSPAALNAHTGTPENLSHLGESARSIFQGD
jgi:hypothetical protein